MHDPVEGGARNCLLCRHFITGPAWLTPLWLNGTKCSEVYQALGRQIEGRNERRAAISREIEATTDSEERRSLQKQENALDVELNELTVRQELKFRAMEHTQELIDICEMIRTDRGGATGADLIVRESGSSVDYVEVSEFEQSVVLTAASRIYTRLEDEATEAKRNAFIDKVLFENGGTPITFSPLTPELKRFGQDALARIFTERLTRAETNALVDGKLRLRDLGLTADVENIVRTRLSPPKPVLAEQGMEAAI